jgi:Haem-binding domain/Cytochrome P460
MEAMASGNRLKTFVTVVAIFFVAFVCIQFVRPRLDNPPVTAELQAPPEVKQVFKNSCYSCHSNETKLPWFDQVVPAYWLVTRDVKEARSHLNFSEIAKLPAAQQKGLLFEAVNQIQLGAMPLPSYLRVHPGAAVTAEELAVLRNYLAPPTPDTATVAPDIAAADEQYTKWIGAGATHLKVSPELNGVAFLPDYKNWKLLSSTDRFDNHTMREILGNDIAIKAIADHHINPWPDGTAFAKVTWKEQPDGTGFVQTGAFVQVELMIRDGKKYASAGGWGWGRWRGTDLKPAGGKDATFAKGCVSCHTPVRQNDYVYTMPLKGQQ